MIEKPVTIITDLNELDERVDELTAAVSFDSVKHTVSELKRALYDNKDFVCICAPQIGEKLRIFVVRNAKSESDRFKVFLNPLIVSSEGLHLSRETNLSFPNKQFIIPRRNKVHVAYQTIDGHVTSETFIGAYGEVVQQMIEMLDGITLADYGLDLDDLGGVKAFDKASKKDQQQVLSVYLTNLKQYYTELAESIENNDDLKQLNDTIKFMTGMLTGDIVPVKKEETENAV